MSTNLSLRSLLDSDKLTDPNFDNWYRRLRIVLEHERILYVITDPAPEQPAPNVRGTVRDTYLKWTNDHTIVRCIMLASMNDEFSRKFKEAQPEKKFQMLKESLRMPDDVERYRVSSAIFNMHMHDGTLVTDHVLYMIEMIKRLGKLGFLLYEQLKKDAILNFPPSFYLDFLSHYRMTKPAVNYHGLLGLL